MTEAPGVLQVQLVEGEVREEGIRPNGLNPYVFIDMGSYYVFENPAIHNPNPVLSDPTDPTSEEVVHFDPAHPDFGKFDYGKFGVLVLEQSQYGYERAMTDPGYRNIAQMRGWVRKNTLSGLGFPPVLEVVED